MKQSTAARMRTLRRLVDRTFERPQGPTAEAWLALPKEERDNRIRIMRDSAYTCERGARDYAEHPIRRDDYLEKIVIYRAMADALESLEPNK